MVYCCLLALHVGWWGLCIGYGVLSLEMIASFFCACDVICDFHLIYDMGCDLAAVMHAMWLVNIDVFSVNFVYNSSDIL